MHRHPGVAAMAFRYIPTTAANLRRSEAATVQEQQHLSVVVQVPTNRIHETVTQPLQASVAIRVEIGRASCRERV